MITGLNFQPWISDKFANNSGKYGKLLILGESHYCEDDENEEQKDDESAPAPELVQEIKVNNFTSAVVESFIENKHNVAFFRNLGLLFNPNDKYEIWKEVAFANGIQVALSNSLAQPTPDEISTIKEAFWLLLDNLNPDKILVCSRRMWNRWLPEDTLKGKYVSHITENGKTSTIWRYQLKEKSCTAMGINHPSKYFSYEKWRPIVMKFLS